MSAIYEAITAKVIKLVERDGLLPWQRPWRTSAPRNGLSGRPYRGVNRLILGLSEFDDCRWLTYRQAQQMGGHVRRGERGSQVVLWRWIDDGQGGERPISKAFTVFNALQCEGLGLLDEADTVEPRAIDSAEAIFGGYANAPSLAFGGDRALYCPAGDFIQMPERGRFTTPERFYATLFHEMVHSTGAAHRLARPGVVDPIVYASQGYALEELIAEIGAAFLSNEAGIDGEIEQSAAYVANWLEALKRDRSMIVRAAGQAQRAVDHILGATAYKANSEES